MNESEQKRNWIICDKARRLWRTLRGKAGQRLAVTALSFCMMVTLIPSVGFAAETGETALNDSVTGFTSGTTYTIADEAQLAQLAALVNSGNNGKDCTFKLTDNINLSGNWTPIGNGSYPFMGIFDGGGHVIYNLKINTTTRYAGLFGRIGTSAAVKNLGLENASVTSTANDVAILAGNAQGGSIEQCYVSGIVKGEGAVSGILGSTHSAGYPTSVSNCYARVALTHTGSTKDIAGISGWNESTSVKITNCCSACIGEVRPIAGWSDGSAVNNGQFVSTYFDKTLSPDFSDGSGRADLGKTSAELKTQETYSGWNFGTVWTIDPGKNGGYPYLQGFAPGLGGAPGSVSVTLKDEENNPVADKTVEIQKSSDEAADKIPLHHQGEGVYSGTVTTTGQTYDVYLDGEKTGTTIMQDGSNAASAVIGNVTSGDVPPPDGYTSDANGLMAYKIKNSSNIIDVKGFYKDNWIQTTYSDEGYKVEKEKIIAEDDVTAKASFINDGRYVQLSYTVTAKDSAITAGKLAVHADVKIGGNDNAAVEVIQDADGNVIGLKMVDDKASNPTHNAQFNLYFAGAGGVTPVDTYWFGYYSDSDKNSFNQLTDETKNSNSGTYSKDGDIFTKLSGADSGMAFSWQNINLKKGESKTYSVILGVGEKSNPPKWEAGDGSASPISLTLAADPQDRKVNVAAKITHTDGITASLFYDINGGAAAKLGDFSIGTDTDSISKTLDLSSLEAGSYDLHFWVVNSSGAASSAVTKTLTINANGQISGGLDGDVPPAGETTQEKLDKLFGQGSATFDDETHKIVIHKDIELDDTVTIDETLTGEKNVVIDLNAKDITVKPDSGAGKDAITVSDGIEVTITGGSITGGNGTGNGAGGDAISGSGSVVVGDGATLSGGDGAGTGAGGSGAAMSGAGSISITNGGKIVGGNGTAAGGNGGTGAQTENGTINVGAGGTVTGGNGADGDNTSAGGDGGAGIATESGSTTVAGTVTGGNGGTGTGSQNGGNGGAGANQSVTIDCSGTITGGNGGNISGGSGKPGAGGETIKGGGSISGGTATSGLSGVNAKAESKQGAPAVTVSEGNLIEGAVTESERKDSGITKIDVTLSVEEKSDSTDKNLVDSKLTARQKIGVYLNIELKKTITKNTNGQTTETVTVAEKPITITLTIPENMRNGSNYKIIRVHDNKAEIITPRYDQSAHTLTFDTDKFSTYAIAYEPKDNPDTPTYVPPYRPGEKDVVTSDGEKTTLHQDSTIKDGVESIIISDGDADKLIAAIEKGCSDNVVIDAQPKAAAPKAETAEISLPVKVASAMIEAGTSQFTYQIGDFIITFDKKAIKAIKQQAKGETILLTAKKDFDGTSGVKVRSRSGAAFIVMVKMTSSDAAINYFDGGRAKVSVKTPFEADAEYAYASGKTAAIDSETKDGWLSYTTDRFDNIPYWGAKAKAGVQKTKIVSLRSKAKRGSVTLTWKKSRSAYKLDGYQVWRSVNKNSKYKLMKTTKQQTYKNTKALKKGTRYYYKVRGVRVIDGKKVYTQWSNKAYRIAK